MPIFPIRVQSGVFSVSIFPCTVYRCGHCRADVGYTLLPSSAHRVLPSSPFVGYQHVSISLQCWTVVDWKSKVKSCITPLFSDQLLTVK